MTVADTFFQAIFFGKEAFTFDNGYAWLSVIVNVPATLFAVTYYEFLFRDSLQNIQGGHAEHAEGEDGLVRHLTKVGSYDQDQAEMNRGYANAVGKEMSPNGNRM